MKATAVFLIHLITIISIKNCFSAPFVWTMVTKRLALFYVNLSATKAPLDTETLHKKAVFKILFQHKRLQNQPCKNATDQTIHVTCLEEKEPYILWLLQRGGRRNRGQNRWGRRAGPYSLKRSRLSPPDRLVLLSSGTSRV